MSVTHVVGRGSIVRFSVSDHMPSCFIVHPAAVQRQKYICKVKVLLEEIRLMCTLAVYSSGTLYSEFVGCLANAETLLLAFRQNRPSHTFVTTDDLVYEYHCLSHDFDARVTTAAGDANVVREFERYNDIAVREDKLLADVIFTHV